MNGELTILLWKEWRLQRTSLLFLLALIPCLLFLGAFLFAPTTASGALGFLGAGVKGSILIGLLAFTGELWVAEARTAGLSFSSRLPGSPLHPALAKWLWAAFVPLALGAYGLAVAWLALLAFSGDLLAGQFLIQENGTLLLLFAMSLGFWMLALGRLLPRVGLGILLALLIHLGPLVFWWFLPMALGTVGASPPPALLALGVLILGALAAFFLPLFMDRFSQCPRWSYAFLLSLFLLSSGSGVLNLISAWSLDLASNSTRIDKALIGHGERYVLLTLQNDNVDGNYLVDIEAKEWRLLGMNYGIRIKRSRSQKAMGIPARRGWSGSGPGNDPASLSTSSLLTEYVSDAEHKGDNRVLDLARGSLLESGDITPATQDAVMAGFDRSIRRASEVYMPDGRKVWVSAQGKIHFDGPDGKPVVWDSEIRFSSAGVLGHGLLVLSRGLYGKPWTKSLYDPSRKQLFPFVDLAKQGLKLVFARSGSWLVRDTRSSTKPSVKPRPWLLYDPSTGETRPALWIPQTTEYGGSKRILIDNNPVLYTWLVRTLALARDGRILYVGSDKIIHLMDPENGRIFTPGLRGPDRQPLRSLSSGKDDRFYIRHRGRSPGGQDIFSIGSEELRRCFLYDPEAQELILAPSFEGTLVCVGKQGLYVTEDNHLFRYQFGSGRRELLFPTPEFRENPELGDSAQRRAGGVK